MENNHYSQKISIFHGRKAPEPGQMAGYGALMDNYKLELPLPQKLSLISEKNRRYETEDWSIYTPRYKPDENLYAHLTFALKYEGINLLFFKKLFDKISEAEISDLIQLEPFGQYSRKIWFLFEWLTGRNLDVPDLNKGNYVKLLDEKLQYGLTGYRSQRQRIVNNLPGNQGFCPLITRTKKLDHFLSLQIDRQKSSYIKELQHDILRRTSAFLLLKDSKASFNIEGEKPLESRAARWANAIGQAGQKELDREELIRLQQLILKSNRFTVPGFRTKGGFVGEHDRMSGEPIPVHISAKAEDLDSLLDAFLQTHDLLTSSEFDGVLTAAIIAFGFVFIHPFADGNGRIHRYLIHHILAKTGFAKKDLIFPVSAAIMNHMDRYSEVLESYSATLLHLIEWESTSDHNVNVLNETADYYRYFDATKQAEFLYECVIETFEKIIPEEVNYIRHYDEFKKLIDDEYDMPDKLVALLVRFLDQNEGLLSKRALKNEFNALSEAEVAHIEKLYKEIFLG